MLVTSVLHADRSPLRAAGALKLVGEGFPWTRGSCFAYTRDNHNSVLGIREQVRSHAAVPLQERKWHMLVYEGCGIAQQ